MEVGYTSSIFQGLGLFTGCIDMYRVTYICIYMHIYYIYYIYLRYICYICFIYLYILSLFIWFKTSKILNKIKASQFKISSFVLKKRGSSHFLCSGK